MVKYLISIFTFLSVSVFSIKAFAAKAASSAMPVHHHIVNNSALFSKSLFFGLSALGGGLAIGLGVIGAGVGERNEQNYISDHEFKRDQLCSAGCLSMACKERIQPVKR